MSDRYNRQIILHHRPEGLVGPDNFELRTLPLPDLAEGEALVRVDWLGIEPTQRTWLNPDPTYVPPARLGEVMPGSGVGEVIASRSPLFKVGTHVVGSTGWQDYAVAGSEGLDGFTRVPAGIEPRDMLGPLGLSGLTAYFGLLEIGRPLAGQTVFVSSAAGSVGSVAGQIARLEGCRVIGSASGHRKCRWLTEVAGFSGVIDRKAENIAERLELLAPGGVDVYFDNVGGPALEAALERLAPGARVVLCGSIASGYRNNDYGRGPANYMQLAFRRARMEGFIVLDYAPRFAEAFAALARWRTEGAIRTEETISVGLGSAPSALAGLFEGRNLGKQLVSVQ